MMMPSLRNWFGRSGDSPPPEIVLATHDTPPEPSAPVLVSGPRRLWAPERIRIVGLLWGEGFQFPGGEPEMLRLARPLGLSAASNVMLLGAGGGGPVRTVAGKLGAWVSGFESDPDLAKAAIDLMARSKLGRRAQIQSWDPADPNFTAAYFHHGLALEPLRDQQPELILAAIVTALKPGGQFTLVETVADAPLPSKDHDVLHWARLERRQADAVPSEIAITRVLGRLGFDVRIAEDISARHVQLAMSGWRRLVRAMETDRPPLSQTALLVEEAELWMQRLKLFRSNQLRLVRWLGISRGTP